MDLVTLGLSLSSSREVFVQEMTSNEETLSKTEREDSNLVYSENPQKKEDLTEATSKEQESESTQTESDPLLLLVTPDLRAIYSQLLSKYPKTMMDTSKWTFSFRGFLLQQIWSIISQQQSKGKEDCLALPLDNFLSTLSEVESLSVKLAG